MLAEDWHQYFTDPQDGRFDTSAWLQSRHGFLAVPLVITEPAVGNGGGLALVFFDRKPERPTAATGDQQATPRRIAPPTVSALFAGATENGTKFGGAGHLGIWRDDTVRFTGAAAWTSLNLKFYGGEDFPRLNDGVKYSLEGWGAYTQLLWRWGQSNVWLGSQMVYLDASSSLEVSGAPTLFDRLEGDITNFGLGLVFSYDSRDNIFSPNRGLQSDWTVREHWGEFLDDFDYTAVDGKNRWYFQPSPSWVLASRLDVSFTSGGTPFYALPFINQRGISKGRYQGEAVMNLEFETRHNFDGRWFGVAFAGVGHAADAIKDLHDAADRWAGGIGFRYLIARVFGLQMGFDVARGPEEWTYYVQVGSGWAF